MSINFAHLRERSTSGGWINFAVFDARSASGTDSGNGELLSQLEQRVRELGLRVDQSSLACRKNGRMQFYGDKNLVGYLSRNGVPRWTHRIDV